MTMYSVSGTDLTNIANAIRTKTGEVGTMTVADMPTEIGSISGGSAKVEFTKDIRFEPSGIGASNWIDDTNTTNLTINGGIYLSNLGNYVDSTPSSGAYFSMPVPNSYSYFYIKCSIESNFTPINNNDWYNCSCILGCELGGEQKDFAIIIDKNGKFALGWATATITSSTIDACDGKIHDLAMFANSINGTISLYIDGVEEVKVNKVMGGSQMTQMGIFWNKANSITKVNGTIYKVGSYSPDFASLEYDFPTF